MKTLKPGLLSLLLLCAMPQFALASEGAFHGPTLKEHGYYLINFLVFAWLLYLIGKGRLAEFWAQRRKAIKEDIDKAAAEFESAATAEEHIRKLTEELSAEVERRREAAEQEARLLAERAAQHTAAEKTRLEELSRKAMEGVREDLVRQECRELALGSVMEAERRLLAGEVRIDQPAAMGAFFDLLSKLEPESLGRPGNTERS